jgi:ferredoxin-NADP reductase
LFFVAREADDAFTRLLFEGAIKPGDAINLWGPSGDFVLRDSQRPLVFAACDTGFAPIKSLIEHALSLDNAPSLSLFWLATRSDGHFQANQCRAWSEALDPFEYALFADSDAAAGARQILAAIRADQFDVDCDYYLAGPDRFVTALGEALLEAGVPAQQIAREPV